MVPDDAARGDPLRGGVVVRGEEGRPEGERSRIDRLSLYKMFPEYNFRTFEIDSVRWEENEVRIYIKGEKKDSPKSKGQSSKGPGQGEKDKRPRQGDLLDET